MDHDDATLLRLQAVSCDDLRGALRELPQQHLAMVLAADFEALCLPTVPGAASTLEAAKLIGAECGCYAAELLWQRRMLLFYRVAP